MVKTTKSAPKKKAIATTRNWPWLLGLGVLFVLFGFLGLSMVAGVTILSILFIGALFLIAGVFQFIDVFKSKKWEVAVWHGWVALFYIFGGGLIIYDPLLASTIITALIAWTLIVIGLIRLIMAITLRSTSGWFFLLIASFAAIVLGGIILMQWPASSVWVIGLFISIELLLNGWSYIFMALSIRKKHK